MSLAQSLPKLPDVERLSPLVIRILGGNPGKFTLQGTNTYLVGEGHERLLIDTGEGRPSWIRNLRHCLDDEKAVVNQVILTHWHPDHVGGLKDILGWAAEKSMKLDVFKHEPGDGQEGIEQAQRFTTSGATLRAVRSPGHTTDHVALVLEEEDAMFTGDNVLGHGTAVFEDLVTYMASLSAMEQEFNGRAYPGHGTAIDDGPAKIKEYVSHRREREDQALDVLKRQKPVGSGGTGWKSMSMVSIIYKDYPEELHGPAEGSLLQVLNKLQIEGRVSQLDDGTWTLADKAAL